MRRAIKPIALAVLCWAAIMADIWLGQRIAQQPCPTTPPRVITRIVTHTVYAPMPMPTPSPVVVVATLGKHGTLCLRVAGKIIDPIGLQDCWGTPDQETRGKNGRRIDPY